jgi:hypothetical protein
VAAEYGPLERQLNAVLFSLANQRGLGTFYWEPTHGGADKAGHVLFDGHPAQLKAAQPSASRCAVPERRPSCGTLVIKVSAAHSPASPLDDGRYHPRRRLLAHIALDLGVECE